MDDSYGGFKRDIFYVGVASGNDLDDGRILQPEDKGFLQGYEFFAPGMGNRVNLFIQNYITYIADNPPQYGLILQWYSRSNARQVINSRDTNEGRRFWESQQSGVWRTGDYSEMFLMSEDASPANPHVRAENANYNFISLPNKSTVSNLEGFFAGAFGRWKYIVPVTALADYLVVRFYKRPADYDFDSNDSIRVWASIGHDAQGSMDRYGFA
jgi:hypothetical protein